MSYKTTPFWPLFFALILIVLFTGCSSDNTGSGPDATLEQTVQDIDGNTYRVVKIGGQTWMAENLKVTRYRNGDPIQYAPERVDWTGLKEGAYCMYKCDQSRVELFGHLYNWYAVSDPRNIAPAGWHVPTEGDWNELIEFLGGPAVAGGKLKASGNELWTAPNLGATDEHGFCAMGCGFRHHTGGFFDHTRACYMWSADERNSYSAWFRYLCCDSASVKKYVYSSSKGNGYSVRCVKDK